MLPSWNTKNDSSGRPADSLAAWFPRRIFQRWNRGVMWKFRPWGRGRKILGKHPAFKSWDWCTQWLEKCHRFHGPLKIMEGSRNPESKTAITKHLFHTGKKTNAWRAFLNSPSKWWFLSINWNTSWQKTRRALPLPHRWTWLLFFLQTCLETHRFAVWRLPLRSFYQLQIPPKKKTSQG